MNNHDLIERNETNRDAQGGTELLQARLYDGTVPRRLLEQVQIVFSRVRNLDPGRKHIFYAHDLAEDPESSPLRDPGFRDQFSKFVFVSHWQMQEYNQKLGVEYARSTVIRNSIHPLEISNRESNAPIRLIYHSTPHRGLGLLVPAFVALAERYNDVELSVYSSFKLYGWDSRDAPYARLIDICKDHPRIHYHGTVPNEEVRKALTNSDIFAYPSIWRETSCLCLIEAMSAGLLCVHPNLAALPETSMGLTWMYQWNEDPSAHASTFYTVLAQAVDAVRTRPGALMEALRLQKFQADRIYNWRDRAAEWTALLDAVCRSSK